MAVLTAKKFRNSWQGNNPSWYAMNGIITFAVDHRGSGHFGKKRSGLYVSLSWKMGDTGLC